MKHWVLGALLAIAVAAGPGLAAQPATGDMTLGRANAPVTLIEYASPTCPVCKQFHDQVLPVLKSTYIDKGKAKLVFREMPSHNPPMDIAIFLLARCAGASKYFSVIDDAYARRDEIEQMANDGKGKDALIAMGKKFGVPAAKVETCISDQAGTQRIADGAQAGMRDFKVTGTPTVIVNGETLPSFGLAEISAKIDEQLKAAGK